MKDIALKDKHLELGAKMVPFAGFHMPLQYSGLSEEHEAVRTGVGIFDVSHMGEFFVRGAGAADLVQRVTSNDVHRLTDGKVQYSCFPNETGGIVDDLLVYRLGEESYLLVVNASNIEKDWDWVSRYNTAGVSLENASDNMSLLAVQGPKATQVLQSLTDMDLGGMKYYTFGQGTFAGVPDVIVSATGYTGSGGFEVYVDNAHATTVWDAILKAGEPHGIKPVGLGARDTLRLEMGFCLYGNDIDDQTSPLEAGLGWITKFTEGNDFVNRTALQQQKEAGVDQKLVAFETIDRGIPRQGYTLEDAAGNTIGRVTSGTMSPSLKKGIGLGYVPKGQASEGSEVYVRIRNKAIRAQVVKLPFYKAS